MRGDQNFRLCGEPAPEPATEPESEPVTDESEDVAEPEAEAATAEASTAKPAKASRAKASKAKASAAEASTSEDSTDILPWDTTGLAHAGEARMQIERTAQQQLAAQVLQAVPVGEAADQLGGDFRAFHRRDAAGAAAGRRRRGFRGHARTGVL